eukprot:m.352689 g.352689  ORF g.352689 m.352689 type:complete len:125 (+) comp19903_c11_seq1:1131-1505(+)
MTNLPTACSFLTPDVARLRGLSNEEQRLLDVQIEVFAYWKTMKKRLIDYVILATRNYLAHQPIVKGKLRQALLEALEAAAEKGNGGFLALVSRSAEQESKLQDLRKRLADLRQADALVSKAVQG